MKIELLPGLKSVSHSFSAVHPVFKYQVEKTPGGISKFFQSYDHFVVVGLGGSVLPLKVFVEALGLQDRIHFLDRLDPGLIDCYSHLPKVLFCVASKSGETLEVKALLSEIVDRKLSLFIATDPEKGFLRSFAKDQKIETLEIPSEIGGRFTNFTALHRALLERFGIDFDSGLNRAREVSASLKKDSSLLSQLYSQLFEQRQGLILWVYNEKLRGLADWLQQLIAESLGKKTSTGASVGILPTVLNGPQDQHSVLQLLMEGPQDKVLWFFDGGDVKAVSLKLPPALKDFESLSLSKLKKVMSDAIFKSFEERLKAKETFQPIGRFTSSGSFEEICELICIFQSFIEYAGELLKINAFDQPGVERGKQIAKELLSLRK